ncbi:hypothetical protein KC902_03545 [Candidatus Kaiserbacteria bacterium]|nr:hypothetical protein [Candidatus Kaiserbacteria bacterium]USN89162.1 MAG: hypothetical protein H6780_01950 [Candidatus Nomurabacteria bacterium]
MHTYLGVLITGPKHSRHLVSELFETQKARDLGHASKIVFDRLRNKVPAADNEQLGYRDLSDWPELVLLEDKTLNWHIVALFFTVGTKTTMKIHLTKGRPSDQFINETAAEDLSHLHGATLIGHHFARFGS